MGWFRLLHQWVVGGEAWAAAYSRLSAHWPGIWDWIKRNWAALIAVLTSTGVGTWFASGIKAINDLGWGAWPFVGVSFALALAMLFYLILAIIDRIRCLRSSDGSRASADPVGGGSLPAPAAYIPLLIDPREQVAKDDVAGFFINYADEAFNGLLYLLGLWSGMAHDSTAWRRAGNTAPPPTGILEALGVLRESERHLVTVAKNLSAIIDEREYKMRKLDDLSEYFVERYLKYIECARWLGRAIEMRRVAVPERERAEPLFERAGQPTGRQLQYWISPHYSGHFTKWWHAHNMMLQQLNDMVKKPQYRTLRVRLRGHLTPWKLIPDDYLAEIEPVVKSR